MGGLNRLQLPTNLQPPSSNLLFENTLLCMYSNTRIYIYTNTCVEKLVLFPTCMHARVCVYISSPRVRVAPLECEAVSAVPLSSSVVFHSFPNLLNLYSFSSRHFYFFLILVSSIINFLHSSSTFCYLCLYKKILNCETKTIESWTPTIIASRWTCVHLKCTAHVPQTRSAVRI